MSTESTTGRVAVITGASSGIGEVTARAFAADGHGVALLARRMDRIQALADQLGDRAIAIQADVTDRDSIVAAAQRVKDEFGGADVLVNNAGVMLLGPFSAELRDDYRRMIETNLLGAITATELFLGQLIAGDGGDLVIVSSVAGRLPRRRRPDRRVWARPSACISSSSCSSRCPAPPTRARTGPRPSHLCLSRPRGVARPRPGRARGRRRPPATGPPSSRGSMRRCRRPSCGTVTAISSFAPQSSASLL